MTKTSTILTATADDIQFGNVLIMPALFREAMDMIFDSYDYFELHDTLDSDLIPPHIQTLVTAEMSRITMRLTSVMAWLMARKAVLAGQISEQEAAIKYRIEGEDYCLNHSNDYQNILPTYIIELLERSHYLYVRVWRLDQQLN